MTRVKRSVNAQKKRRKVLAEASGYWGLKSKVYRRAKEQVRRSGNYAYRDRRARDHGRIVVLAIWNVEAALHRLHRDSADGQRRLDLLDEGGFFR